MKNQMRTSSMLADFTQGDVTKQLVRFSLPLFLSNLFQIVYNMIDMIVVGHVLGKNGLSGVSVGGDIQNFLTFFAMGFSNAGQVIIAQYIGRKEKEKLGRLIAAMFTFLFGCVVVISIVCMFCRESILGLMNTPEEAFPSAMSYATICMIGLVFIYGYNAISAVLRGMGDSKHPFIFISIAAVLNVLLDVVFVVFLDLGAGGAALATVISQGVSFLSCAGFILSSRRRIGLEIRGCDFFHPDGQMVLELIHLGLPMALKSASIQFSKLFVDAWINSYGVAISAFAGIANKINSMSNLVSNALNTAGSSIVGQNIGAQKYDRVKEILKRIAVITISLSTALSVAIVIFPTQIYGIFTHEQEVLDIGVKFVPIAILIFYGSALRCPMNALINGSGNYRVNFVTALLDGVIMRIGLSVLFGVGLNLKHYGFWLGDALAGFTPLWIGMDFYHNGKWKNSRTLT